MLDTYVESYMFEPSNYLPCADPVENLYIMNEYPSTLHPYNNGFDQKDPRIKMIEVDCSRDLGTCVGPGDNPHSFMLAEGHIECNACKHDLCMICALEIKNEKDNKCESYCIGCYSEEKCLPTRKEYIQAPELTVTNEDMVVGLQSLGMQVRVTDDMTDINDIYDSLVFRGRAIYDGVSLMDQIIYPTNNTTYLAELVKITEMILKDGGRYLSSSNLTTFQKIELSELLTELTNTPRIKNTNEDRSYQVIPHIMRLFAEGSRIQTGYRLLKRAIRHAMDPKAHDIRASKWFVIQEDGELGLVIQHKVKASMKSTIYNTHVAFTGNKLIACSCDCKAGSFWIERVLCVHVLPILFQVCQLMHMALSEHILIELSNFFTDTRNMIDLDKQNLLEIIRTLVRSDSGIQPDDITTIESLLGDYSVGTQRTKSRMLRGPLSHIVVPTVIKHCPLRRLVLDSALMKARKQQHQNVRVQNQQNIDDEQEIIPITTETYDNICNTIALFVRHLKGTSFSKDCFEDLIGFRLL
jgi:hypothetical protein